MPANAAELALLPFVESRNLQPMATVPAASAAGIWQFIAGHLAKYSPCVQDWCKHACRHITAFDLRPRLITVTKLGQYVEATGCGHLPAY